MSDLKWLEKHTKPILQASDEVKRIEPEIFNEFGEWSVFKLIALVYFMNVYTRIIRNQDWVKKMRYIELFSGSGLCQINEKGDLVAGSPVLATKAARSFDELVLVEMNEDYCRALNSRMKAVGAHFTVYNEDCNSAIPRIVDGFDDHDHYLAFVDCQSGTEVKWDTLERLLSKQGDLVFNFQTVNVHRSVMLHKGDQTLTTKSLDEFYGGTFWMDFETRDDCLNGFIQKLRETTSRTIVKQLTVKNSGGFYYDVLIATKPTKGNNQWIRAIDELQERLDRYDTGLMKAALEIFTERQDTLDKYSRK
jgi:three-Cys-motif partner protein